MPRIVHRRRCLTVFFCFNFIPETRPAGVSNNVIKIYFLRRFTTAALSRWSRNARINAWKKMMKRAIPTRALKSDSQDAIRQRIRGQFLFLLSMMCRRFLLKLAIKGTKTGLEASREPFIRGIALFICAYSRLCFITSLLREWKR